MAELPVLLVTGASRGIGRHLVDHYSRRGFAVLGCSRRPPEQEPQNYRHFCLDVGDESAVKELFAEVARTYGRLDVLINNAGIASMNHSLLTPLETVRRTLDTNFVGTFLFSREAAKLMQRRRYGRIVNLVSVATPLKLEGESVYASAKAAVMTLTQILARELAEWSITVNAVGPAPTETDLIRSVPREKLDKLVARQAIRRMGEFRDVSNVIDFFIQPESDFVTGQVIYLGGVS